MSQFQLHGEWYEFVDPNDLDGEELDLLERHTASNMLDMTSGNPKFSMWGLMWLSVRRRVPSTTWDDIKREKLMKCEWRASPGEENVESLPPISSGDAASSTEDDQTPHLAPIDIGSLG